MKSFLNELDQEYMLPCLEDPPYLNLDFIANLMFDRWAIYNKKK